MVGDLLRIAASLHFLSTIVSRRNQLYHRYVQEMTARSLQFGIRVSFKVIAQNNLKRKGPIEMAVI